MASGSSPRKYDFFISRSGPDAAVAQEVADALRSAGHTVRYQDEDIPFGSNFIERMSALVEDCRNLLIILSPAYLDSPYCREEWTNFLADLFSAQEDRRVVVLIAQDCKPPGILRARVFGSLAGKADPAERRETIIAAAEGRAARLPMPPPIFERVPPRDPDFFGREDELKAIRQLLTGAGTKAPGSARTVAVTGPAAVGTSSVAAEYAHRHAGDYWGVWWMPAESRSLLVASLADLAGRLGANPASQPMPLGSDPEPLARTALSLLRNAPLPWLLVYDNAASPDTLGDLLPFANAHALIVSRWPDWHGLAAEVPIEVFAPDVAAHFLCERAGSSDMAGAERLAGALGCLPLALDQAGALCRRTGLSFDDYAARMTELIRMTPSGTGKRRSVFATFRATLDEAAGQCPPAEKLMGFLAFLAPNGVPVSFIGAEAMDLMERTAALEALTAVSLLTISNRHMRVHRLVQEVMRQRVHEGGQFDGLRPVLHAMLAKAAAKEDAPGGRLAIFESVLWTLHHDPSATAELQVGYAHDQTIDIEVTFTKAPDGIRRVFRVMNSGKPFHRIESLYYLQNGWKTTELSNRTF